MILQLSKPLVFSLACVTVVLNVLLATKVVFRLRHKDVEPDYSYIGNDYPLHMPLTPLGEVEMTYYESVHYAINGFQKSEVPELDTLVKYPKGRGRVRLGPEWRTFTLVYYHQLHCVYSIYLAFSDPDQLRTLGIQNGFTNNEEHLEHCFCYLRQTFLCEAADSLEKDDFLNRNYTTNRMGGTVVCKDWDYAMSAAAENYESWRDRHGNW